MKKLFIALALVVGLIGLSAPSHAAGSFVLTPHVEGTTTHWTAQTALLHGGTDHTIFLAAGECSPQKFDVAMPDLNFTLMSLGQICGYAAGSVSGTGPQFAPIVTTGGSLFGIEQFHWDLGYQMATTSSDPDTPKMQIVFGVGLMIPF